MQNPLAEVFGFPIYNQSEEAVRCRNGKLCPFNNKVPNCTKDKANNPLGICSINHNGTCVITCPVRFRENWLIAEHAAKFFFGEETNWTTLTETKLLDINGQSAGNIDFVLVAYNKQGKITNFGSLEVQGVYISGNLRNPFDAFMRNPLTDFSWETGFNFPKPDYLSSSRKRLVPQMLYKGGIFKHWGQKQAVSLQKSFFDTLPILPQVEPEKADIAWFLYDLLPDEKTQRLKLTLVETVYTEFEAALFQITTPRPGSKLDFVSFLQSKLDDQFESSPPDAPTLQDILKNDQST